MTRKRIIAVAFVVFVLAVAGWQTLRRRPVSQQPSQAAATQQQGSGQPFSFSIQGHAYKVVFDKKEPGNAVVGVHIQDSSGRAVFERIFPYKPEANDPSDIESDVWSAEARMVTRGAGSGLLMTYGENAEPSAPVPENTTWYQLFGLVNGELKAFSAPIAVEGELIDTPSDLLEFKVWAHHFRIVFPLRVDWAAGKLVPADTCETCDYKVLPEERWRKDELTFARMCAMPQVECENPERVLVKPDSQLDLVRARVSAKLDNEGITVGDDVWLLIRVDGKEGWIHDDEDFYALALPFEQ
jgi:hypothetical protein